MTVTLPLIMKNAQALDDEIILTIAAHAGKANSGVRSRRY
jgi:hypothetical protein